MKTALLCALLAGCATMVTNVVPTGPDTYMVSSHGVMGWSSSGEQKAKAFETAGAYCKRSGKVMVATNTSETPGGFGRIASGDVEFRCVTP